MANVRSTTASTTARAARPHLLGLALLLATGAAGAQVFAQPDTAFNV